MDFVPEHLRAFVRCRTHIEKPYLVQTFTVRGTDRNGNSCAVFSGNDDLTYSRHPELLELIPRGFSILYIRKDDQYEHVVELRGPVKFSGTTDKSGGHTPAQLSNLDAPRQWEHDDLLKVTWQEKANGKFALFHVMRDENGWYIFGGSKNRHVMRRLGAVGSFVSPGGCDLHHQILRRIVDDLRHLTEEQMRALGSLPTAIVGEYVDGRHLVWTNSPYMVYFNTPIVLPLAQIPEFFPQQTTMPTEAQLCSVRVMTETEGAVICYENTATGEVIRQKHKSIWYTVWRAFREILCRIKTPTSQNQMEILNRCTTRLNEIAATYLVITETQKMGFLGDLMQFICWMGLSRYEWADTSFSSAFGMAHLYHEYRHGVAPQVNYSGQVDMKVDAEPALNVGDYGAILTEESLRMICVIRTLARRGAHLSIITVGAPGCGKSTVCDWLATELTEQKISTSTHCTDDLFRDENGRYHWNARQLGEKHGQNYEAWRRSRAQVRFCVNTNTTRRERQRYMNEARARSSQCVILYFKEDDPVVLKRRCTHTLDLSIITRMHQRIQRQSPIYYSAVLLGGGITNSVMRTSPGAMDVFMNRHGTELMTAFVDQHGMTMIAAPHVTLYYCGGTAKKSLRAARATALAAFMAHYEAAGGTGSRGTIQVNGISNNDAGSALVLHPDHDSVFTSMPSAPHVTLMVNHGFKPNQVGQNIAPENTTAMKAMLEVILCPVW